jgi:hypothetical protein
MFARLNVAMPFFRGTLVALNLVGVALDAARVALLGDGGLTAGP